MAVNRYQPMTMHRKLIPELAIQSQQLQISREDKLKRHEERSKYMEVLVKLKEREVALREEKNKLLRMHVLKNRNGDHNVYYN
jgi:hypothetical protein